MNKSGPSKRTASFFELQLDIAKESPVINDGAVKISLINAHLLFLMRVINSYIIVQQCWERSFAQSRSLSAHNFPPKLMASPHNLANFPDGPYFPQVVTFGWSLRISHREKKLLQTTSTQQAALTVYL